jgi:hypothetical protein
MGAQKILEVGKRRARTPVPQRTMVGCVGYLCSAAAWIGGRLGRVVKMALETVLQRVLQTMRQTMLGTVPAAR